MTDTTTLRSIIANSGLKYKAIAEIMGLTPYSLQMKIDNETCLLYTSDAADD